MKEELHQTAEEMNQARNQELGQQAQQEDFAFNTQAHKAKSPKWPFIAIGIAVIALALFIITRFIGGSRPLNSKEELMAKIAAMPTLQADGMIEDDLGLKSLQENTRNQAYSTSGKLSLTSLPGDQNTAIFQELGLNFLTEQDPLKGEAYLDLSLDFMGEQMELLKASLSPKNLSLSLDLLYPKVLTAPWEGDIEAKINASPMAESNNLSQEEIQEITAGLSMLRDSLTQGVNPGYTPQEFMKTYPELAQSYNKFIDQVTLESHDSVEMPYGDDLVKADSQTLLIPGEALKALIVESYDFFTTKELNAFSSFPALEDIPAEREEMVAALDAFSAQNETISLNVFSYNDMAIKAHASFLTEDLEEVEFTMSKTGPRLEDGTVLETFEFVINLEEEDLFYLSKTGETEDDDTYILYYANVNDGSQVSDLFHADLSWDRAQKNMTFRGGLLPDDENIAFALSLNFVEVDKGNSFTADLDQARLDYEGETLCLDGSFSVAPADQVSQLPLDQALNLFEATESEFESYYQSLGMGLFRLLDLTGGFVD